MDRGLTGQRVAILATDGVEQVELEEPRRALEAAGATTHLIAQEEGSIQAVNRHEQGARIPVDRVLGDARPGEYDALLLPGGVANPDRLRTDERAVQFVREFMLADKPVAAICHAAWMLVEANAVAGRTLTSWPSLQTDIRNAGGEWVDVNVRVDDRLITSRKPEDLPAFCAAIVREFATTASADERPVLRGERAVPATESVQDGREFGERSALTSSAP